MRSARILVLGALWGALTLAPVPLQAQSAACQSIDDTVRTCEDGFTCAYTFTGGVRYERFTFRIIESANPTAEVSIIVEVTEGDFRTVSEGRAEEGDVFAWTVRSDAEGDSFFRVANTNSNGDIRTRFTCDQADTTLDMPADAGDDVLSVASDAPFSVDDTILINPGGATEETAVVTGFGSLQLASPLQFAHAAGETVVSLSPSTTPAEAGPVPAAFALEAAPNPAGGVATIRLGLDAPEAVVVAVYDVLGRRVALLHEGPLASGTHPLPFDTRELPAGAYLVRAEGASGTAVRRITVAR